MTQSPHLNLRSVPILTEAPVDPANPTPGQPQSPWTPAPSGTKERLNAIWGRGPGSIHVAGADLYVIWAFDPSRIFVAGAGGTLLRSMDGGASWAPCFNEPLDLLSIGGSPGEVVVASRGGPLFRSEDGGDTWSAMNGIPAGPFTNVWVSEVGDIHALGEAGSIARTRGFNQPWIGENQGTAHSLRALWGSAPDHLLAVGEGGAILRGPAAT